MRPFITAKPLEDISSTATEFGNLINKFGQIIVNLGLEFPSNEEDPTIPIRQNVTAAHNGVVTKTGNFQNYGNTIIIEDKSGQATLYAGLSSINVAVNQEISASQLIGALQSPSRLHFEVLPQETAIKVKNSPPNFLGIDVSDVRDNPRFHLAQAFPDVKVFSPALQSGNWGTNLTGDYRDDYLFANSHSNVLTGQGGSDVYIFPQIAGKDVIDEVNADGTIMSMSNGNIFRILQGNAIPRVDDNGNIISNQWGLNGYSLTKIGNDLVITNPQENPNLGEVENSITIKNFNFDAKDNAFGITLNAKIAPGIGKTITYQTSDLLGGNVFASDDRRGRYFFTRLQRDDDGTKLLLEIRDARGTAYDKETYEIDSTTTLGFMLGGNEALRLQNGNVAYLYSCTDPDLSGASQVRDSRVKLALIDPSGNLISVKTIASQKLPRGGLYDYFLPSALRTVGDSQYFCYYEKALESIAGKYYNAEFSSAGDILSTGNVGGAPAGVSQNNKVAHLPNGYVVDTSDASNGYYITFVSGANQTYEVLAPNYVQAKSGPVDYVLSQGTYVVNALNSHNSVTLVDNGLPKEIIFESLPAGSFVINGKIDQNTTIKFSDAIQMVRNDLLPNLHSIADSDNLPEDFLGAGAVAGEVIPFQEAPDADLRKRSLNPVSHDDAAILNPPAPDSAYSYAALALPGDRNIIFSGMGLASILSQVPQIFSQIANSTIEHLISSTTQQIAQTPVASTYRPPAEVKGLFGLSQEDSTAWTIGSAAAFGAGMAVTGYLARKYFNARQLQRRPVQAGLEMNPIGQAQNNMPNPALAAILGLRPGERDALAGDDQMRQDQDVVQNQDVVVEIPGLIQETDLDQVQNPLAGAGAQDVFLDIADESAQAQPADGHYDSDSEFEDALEDPSSLRNPSPTPSRVIDFNLGGGVFGGNSRA